MIVTTTAGASKTVTADWYVCAMPSERAAPLMNAAVVAADPRLANIARLRQDWMTGLVFFLREPFPVVHGHVNDVDSPFAVTSISQQQFWDVDCAATATGRRASRSRPSSPTGTRPACSTARPPGSARSRSWSTRCGSRSSATSTTAAPTG